MDCWLRPVEDLHYADGALIRVSCFLLPLHTPSPLLCVGKREHTRKTPVRNRISSHLCNARSTKYDLQNNAACCEKKKPAVEGHEVLPRSRPLHSRVLRERSRALPYASCSLRARHSSGSPPCGSREFLRRYSKRYDDAVSRKLRQLSSASNFQRCAGNSPMYNAPEAKKKNHPPTDVSLCCQRDTQASDHENQNIMKRATTHPVVKVAVRWHTLEVWQTATSQQKTHSLHIPPFFSIAMCSSVVSLIRSTALHTVQRNTAVPHLLLQRR